MIYFVGEAPRKSENNRGLSSVGKAGQKLDDLMQRVGLDPKHCRWGNIVRCIPWENDVRGNKVRPPSEYEMDRCAIHIEKEVMRANPVIIMTLGGTATYYFTGLKKITSLRGRRHPVSLPTVRYRFMRMLEWLAIKKIQDMVLIAADTPPKRERAILKAAKQYGFKDVATRVYTIYPSMDPASILYGNPSAEKDILSDLNYLASRVQNRDETSNYKLLTTLDDVRGVIRRIHGEYKMGKFPYLAYDLEATSLRMYDLNEKVTTIGIGYKPDEAWIIPWDHHESPFKGDMLAQAGIKSELNAMFEDVPINAQNAKYDYGASVVRGINIKEIGEDTELQSWTLFNDQSEHDLETLTSRYTDLSLHKQEMKEAQDAMPKEEKYNTDNYDLGLISRYNGADVDSCTRLAPVFHKAIVEAGLYNAHKEIALASVIPTTHMEINGCLIDLKFVDKLRVEMEAEIAEYYERFAKWGISDLIERLLYDDTKKPDKQKKFSLSSPDQVSLLFFEVLELKAIEYGKVRKNGIFKGKRVGSTAKAIVQELMEDCNAQLGKLEDQSHSENYQMWKLRLDALKTYQGYQQVSKLYSSYVKNLPTKLYSDGFVRCSYGIRHTETGRFNCKDPSLHVIPWHSIIKQMFISRFVNGLIFSGDFGQMELRVFAMASGDPDLIRTFNEGRDIHNMIASRVLEISEDQVPDHERRRIKTVNFGLLYGRGSKSIAAQEGMSQERAQELIDGVFKQFPLIAKFIKDTHKFVRANRYVPYINGFRRIINFYEDDKKSVSKAERQSVNSRIQGPASDLAASSMIMLEKLRKKLRFNSKLYQFIHDSLGYDTPPGEMFDLAILFKKVCTEKLPRQFSFINVPLVVDFEVGISWGHLVGMTLLDSRQARFKGKKEYFEPMLARMQEWQDAPTLLSLETEVKKEPKVIRSLIRTSGLDETIDVEYIDAVMQFPAFARREPDYINQGLSIAA